MSVLPNQTNITPGDAFFWKIDASTITAKSFISDRVLTTTLSTGSVITGNISTTGSIIVSGDVTATGTVTGAYGQYGDLTSYFINSQYETIEQVLNVTGVANIPELGGSNATFTNVAIDKSFISSIQTTNILLDGNSLDTGGAGIGAVLLLNGYPIATTSTSISSLVEWSLYPAISTLYLEGNNILEVGELSGNIVNVQTVSAFDVAIENQLTVGQTLFGNQAEFQEVITSDLTTNTLEALVGSISSLTVSTLNTNSVVIPTGTFSNLIATNINTTNITAVAGSISDFAANSANVGSANINSINATNATISGTLTQNEVRGVNGFINEEAANRIRIRVLGSSDVFSSPELDLEAGGGNRGIVKITANPGFAGIQGECTINAKGGSAAGYATGGLLNLTAERGTSIFGTASYSRVGIAADSITSYAGGPTPFAGIYGYNFMYGLLGVNLVAGTPPVLPNVAGTVYLYGLNPLGAGSSGGVRINNGLSVDVLYPYPQGFIAPEYDLIIRGNPAGQKVTLSNVRYLFGDSALLTGFNDVNSVNITGTNLNGSNIFASNLTASNLNTPQGNISSLNTQNAAISRLFNVSTINGYTIDQLISSVTPPQFVSTVSTFNQLFTSSIQFNGAIGTVGNIQSLVGISTINGYTLAELVSTTTPTVFPSTVSSFDVLAANQFTTSSILGNTLNLAAPGGIFLNGIQPLSTLTSTFNLLYASLFYATSVSTALLSVSTINGYNISQLVNQGTVSTFSNIYVSDALIFNQTSDRLFVSSINGFNTSQFLSTPGTTVISTFNQLFASSFNANTISTTAISLSTLNGYTISQLVNNPIVSTFNQFFTSSIAANGISSATASIQQLNNVSTINNITIAQFVSSVSPPIPAPSTFNQLFTSSLAVNAITNYQTSFLDMTAPAISVTAASLLELEATQCNITLTSPNLLLNASANISLNSVNMSNRATNTMVLYTTPTAPALASNEIAIVAEGPASLQSLGVASLRGGTSVLVDGTFETNITSVDTYLQGSNSVRIVTPNLLLNGASFPFLSSTASTFNQLFTTTLSNNPANANMTLGAVAILTLNGDYVVTNTNTILQLNSSNEILATSPNINLNGTVRINGVPYAPPVQTVSTFNQLFTSSFVTNTINGAAYPPPVTETVSTFNQLFTSSLVTNTINGAAYPPPPSQTVSTFPTLFVSSLINTAGDGISFTSPEVTFYTGSLLTECFGFIVDADNEINITAGGEIYISSSYTEFQGDEVKIDGTLTVLALQTVSSINGAVYPPPSGGAAISTFNQLFTSSLVTNTINGVAYPPPDSNTISTFNQLFTSSIVGNGGNFTTLFGNEGTFSNITLIGGTAELFATQGSLQINASNTLTLGGAAGMVMTSLSNNIILEPGFVTPAQFQIRGDTNFCNNNLLNVNQINGYPYSPTGNLSSFQTIYTSSILMNTGTFCNLFALGTDPKITAEDDLSIQASNTLAITGQQGIGLVSLSNDISFVAGFSGPGEVRITASPLNMCNFDVNNVAVLNATTINNTTLNNQTINTTTLNGRTATLSTLHSDVAYVSSAMVSTLNTFPYHKAFGIAWATGTTPMVGGVPAGVDWGGTHYFNLSDIISGETSLLPAIVLANRGIYQVNSRVTFSNSDSVVATASSYLTIDGYDDPISRVSVEVEPSRTASAIITWQGFIEENISLSIYSDNSNVQMYEYAAGSPYPPYRAYAANITLHQLYSYYAGGAWPQNPLVYPVPEI